MSVVTRIAPSPTGEMHIGTVRTALFNYLFAKHHGGKFIVRIEDTDTERNKPEWVDAIWRDLEWCGLSPDARYVQSEHVERHRALLKQLIDSGKAYVSAEPAKGDPSRTIRVVRLRNPGATVAFEDLIRGTVAVDTSELGDFVIARAVDDPLFHFAVVVDDHDEGVTHVIRGDDHISNTPRQLLVLEALGFDRPRYAHIPLILAPDRSKLSKRKHGASIERYRKDGYLPQAIINYLALLGWNPGREQELFSLPELIDAFALEQVQKGGAVFDIEKLKWFNRQHIQRLSGPAFVAYFEPVLRGALDARNMPFDPRIAAALAELLRHSITTSGEFAAAAASGEFDFFFTDPKLDAARIPDARSTAADARAHLEHVAGVLPKIAPFRDAEAIKSGLWDYATEHGRGAVLWPMRYALSGREKSPDPFVIASIIGKDAAIRRIRYALNLLAP